jgi:hypothetical protein
MSSHVRVEKATTYIQFSDTVCYQPAYVRHFKMCVQICIFYEASGCIYRGAFEGRFA